MLSKTPAALLDTVIESVWSVLKTARPDEIEGLTWKSPLADRIGNAVCTALPHQSITDDTKLADLLLAASNVCPPNLGTNNLDCALAVASRALYRRALNIEPVQPIDLLARFDVLLVLIHEAWFSDNDDLVWFVSQLRRQSAALVAWPSPTPPRYPTSPSEEKRKTIFQIVTGGPVD